MIKLPQTQNSIKMYNSAKKMSQAQKIEQSLTNIIHCEP